MTTERFDFSVVDIRKLVHFIEQPFTRQTHIHEKP